MDPSQEQLYELLFERVVESDLSPAAGELVLAAFEGNQELAQALDGAVTERPPRTAERPQQSDLPGVFLQAIEVEGFRGIGPKASLRLQPGPGLTLVVGRNGSGKSSFAEAAELALTGDNYRWRAKTNVWRDGWRNLHHPDPSALAVQLVVEGQQGATTIRRSWKSGQPLEEAGATSQAAGAPRQLLDALGWARPLQTYRPFLSYAELGSLVEGPPSQMFDALESILGLDHLNDAVKRLNETHKQLEVATKAPKSALSALRAALEASADERATRALELVRGRTPELDALEALATGTDDAEAALTSKLQQLRRLQPPDLDHVQAVAKALRETSAAATAVAGTDAAKAHDHAQLLREALQHHEAHGNSACPVCGTGSLDEGWRVRAAQQVSDLEESAREVEPARHAQAQAVEAARRFITEPPAWLLGGSISGIDTAALIQAWSSWAALRQLPPAEIADALEGEVLDLQHEMMAVAEAAEASHVAADTAWKPLAATLLSWVGTARTALAREPAVSAVKAALTWLKNASADLRHERLQPFATQSAEIWGALRQQSSVELGPIRLAGSANRRRVALEVSIDGVDSAALGVMSQGELHALGLALFLPRATAAASPFRFLVIDDPVQAMDPAKVDGLARVLADVARTRQVVVFTHDDRLPEAVRRLQLPAVVWEVVRREGSVVEVRKSVDPVARYLEDARALARTEQLPAEVAAVLVPTFCRGAVEAACHERTRRRRLGDGSLHADVETALDVARTTNQQVALALFDDSDRGGEVLSRLKAFGSWAVPAYQAIRSGTHQALGGDLRGLVEDAAKLAEKLRA